MDNASSNDTFVGHLARKMKEDAQVEWDWKNLRFRCFDHILNLAAQSALEEIKEDIGKVIIYILVVYIHILC
jgi:hypothetical protein